MSGACSLHNHLTESPGISLFPTALWKSFCISFGKPLNIWEVVCLLVFVLICHWNCSWVLAIQRWKAVNSYKDIFFQLDYWSMKRTQWAQCNKPNIWIYISLSKKYLEFWAAKYSAESRPIGIEAAIKITQHISTRTWYNDIFHYFSLLKTKTLPSQDL